MDFFLSQLRIFLGSPIGIPYDSIDRTLQGAVALRKWAGRWNEFVLLAISG